MAAYTNDQMNHVRNGSSHSNATADSKTSSHFKEEFPVVLTTYEMILSDGKRFLSKKWKYLVVDEGQRLKNRECRLLKILKAFDSGNRLLLSGTPLQNNLAELWSLLNFLLPDIFNSLDTFTQWFNFDEELVRATRNVLKGGGLAHNKTGESGKEPSSSSSATATTVAAPASVPSSFRKILKDEQTNRMLTKLHAILNPFLLRRLKSDVAIELLPKKEYVIYAEMSSLQRQLSQAILEGEIDRFIDTKTRAYRQFTRSKNKVSSDSSQNASMAELYVETNPYVQQNNVLMQMRKVCNHPYLFVAPVSHQDPNAITLDSRLVEVCGKMKLLDRMLNVLKENGNKVLIFCQMTRVMDLLEDYMDMRGYKFCRIDGKVKSEQREKMMKQFNTDNSTFVFLLSTRAGGLGISLPAADTVIIYDSDVNPQQDLQAQDRAHRIGQTKTVAVYRFLTRNSGEMSIHHRATQKRKLELLTINRKMFKGQDKGIEHLQGSTEIRSAADLRLRSSLSLSEVKYAATPLQIAGFYAFSAHVFNKSYTRILTERGDKAPVTGGVGFEVVDGETSSFM
eukprot:jgi/Bigna1/66241/fgenesh1_pg.1_\